MITIDEVKNITFRKANLGGYRTEDVEAFIEEIADTLETNKKEKIELVHKLDILAKRIEEYRKDEEDVKGALLNAQKIKNLVIDEAKEEAEKILSSAKEEAILAKQEVEDISINTNISIINQKNEFLKLQADAVLLRETLLKVYNEHIKNIELLPTPEQLEEKKAELDELYPTTEEVAVKVETPKEVEKAIDLSSLDDEVDISKPKR